MRTFAYVCVPLVSQSLDFTFSASYAHFATARTQKPEIRSRDRVDGRRAASRHPGRAMYGDIRVWLTSFDASGARRSDADDSNAPDCSLLYARRGAWAAGVGVASSGARLADTRGCCCLSAAVAGRPSPAPRDVAGTCGSSTCTARAAGLHARGCGVEECV